MKREYLLIKTNALGPEGGTVVKILDSHHGKPQFESQTWQSAFAFSLSLSPRSHLK